MANSKYEYVKNFESSDGLLPQCWIVVRIDGRAFTKFTAAHEFEKPNDERALNLMNACAKAVMEDLTDIVFAYGVSDEYSFVFRKSSTLYKRRASKLVSVVVSLFAANFVLLWPKYLTPTLLQSAPAFDARAVLYPNNEVLRDYLAWRQVSEASMKFPAGHVNNQYNTCYHALVKSGVTPEKAQENLKGTQAEYKNELLYTDFSINYSKLPAIFRKGSCVYRQQIVEQVRKDRKTTEVVVRSRWRLVITHEDIIGDKFWKDNPQIVGLLETTTEQSMQP